MDAGALAGRLFGSAVVASGRPVAAAFGLQAVVALAVHAHRGALPPELAWVTSPLALGVGLAAVLIEVLVRHTEGADELLRSLHLDQLLAGLAGVPAMATLLLLTSVTEEVQDRAAAELVAAGVAPAEAEAWVDEAALALVAEVGGREGAPPPVGAQTAEVVRAIQVLEDSQVSQGTKGLLLAVAVALQAAMLWIRGEVREVVEDLELERLWAWLETGGIAVGLALVVFAPILLLILALLLALASVVALAAIRLGSAAMDAARRRPCPSCRASIRVEASRCPSCRAEVEPVRLLGERAASEPAPAPAAS